MAAFQTGLTILFADIAQSTRLYDVLGDETAQNLIEKCLAGLSRIAVLHHGTVIKTIGDEVMCTFREAEHALAGARAMNEAMDKLLPVGQGSDVSLDLRVGIHKGQVIEKESDVFGDAVNVAARLVRFAKPRQTLLSRDIVDGLTGFEKALIRNLGNVPVRGKTESLSICELVWEEYDMTIIASQPRFRPGETIRMELRHGESILEIGPSRPFVTIGRGKSNDLAIAGSHVSRSHARIDFLAGKFLLSDQSSNGTYVSFRKEKPVHLKRDKLVLYGTGSISPGLKASGSSRDIILFREIP